MFEHIFHAFAALSHVRITGWRWLRDTTEDGVFSLPPALSAHFWRGSWLLLRRVRGVSTPHCLHRLLLAAPVCLCVCARVLCVCACGCVFVCVCVREVFRACDAMSFHLSPAIPAEDAQTIALLLEEAGGTVGGAVSNTTIHVVHAFEGVRH